MPRRRSFPSVEFPRRLGVAAALVLACALGACAEPSGEGHIARVHGIRMYYEVHGRAGDGRQFSHQVPDFARQFRVIVPDLRAQGRSTDGPGALTYHGMAEDVLALMNHLHVRRANVMGWSDGGIVGLDLAIHHPD